MSSRQLLRALASFGFEVVATRAGHAKLCRVRGDVRQILTVPIHAELPPGTLRAILRQACRFIPEAELRSWLYR